MIEASASIEEVMEKYPGTARVFMDVGIHWLVCGEPFGTPSRRERIGI